MTQNREYFITGCHLAIVLGGDAPGCETRELASVESYSKAKEICRTCPRASINIHVEDAVGNEEQIAPEQESRVQEQEEWVPPGWPTEVIVIGREEKEEKAEEPAEELATLADFGVDPEPAPEAPIELPKAKSALGDDIEEENDAMPIDISKMEAWGARSPGRVVEESGPPSVDAILASIGIRGGPSIMGWSKLSTALKCLRRFCYAYVMGLRNPIQVIRTSERYGPSVHPLPLGSALHAIHEIYCMSFFDTTAAVKVLNAIKPHYPLLAAETARLWRRYWRAFHDEDLRAWDVRLVEAESRLYFKEKKVAGKKRSLCISSRHDTVIAKTENGRRLAPGVRSPKPLHLHDLKTIGQMSSAAQETWAHEGQSLQGMATWNKGHGVSCVVEGVPVLTNEPLAELYGPAWGFTVTQIGKAQGNGNEEDYTRRLPYTVDGQLVDEFAANMEDFLYCEIAPRLFHAQCNDEATWRKSYACRDPITNKVCPFAVLCESAGRADPTVHFEIDPKMRLRGEDLERPRTTKRSRKKKKPVEGADK